MSSKLIENDGEPYISKNMMNLYLSRVLNRGISKLLIEMFQKGG